MAKVYVSDTNIWIDFYHASLLNELFKLPFSLCCTEFVAFELDEPNLTPLVALGLIIEPLSGEEIQELGQLTRLHNNPSLADMSCYYLAKERQMPLLTGDGQLRALAKSESVQVHGALWLLDQLVAHKIVATNRAAVALQTMLDNNARLPAAECRSRFEHWK